ncbi:MAG: ATP synthase F1 subunit gamma [Bacteroidales bacterium]
MANLKEIRNRIASVTSTRQITSAMKMVSAAKLRRAQDAISRQRPYTDKLKNILSGLTSTLQVNDENIYVRERPLERVLLVVATSNKGLCGAFNMNVIKHTLKLIHEEYPELYEENRLNMIIIGKKANEFFRSRKYRILSSYDELYDNLTFDNVVPVIENIMGSYVKGEYDRVEIIYNQFKNAAVQIVMREQFLPLKLEHEEDEDAERQELPYDYIFEPSKDDLLSDLIPRSLKMQFYKTLLDSHASEHGARMTAMHKASDNATELLKELRLSYNKARQASITNEILEIVGGAEALKG